MENSIHSSFIFKTPSPVASPEHVIQSTIYVHLKFLMKKDDSSRQYVGRVRPGVGEGAAGHPDPLYWSSPLRVQHGLLSRGCPRHEGGDEVGELSLHNMTDSMFQE